MELNFRLAFQQKFSFAESERHCACSESLLYDSQFFPAHIYLLSALIILAHRSLRPFFLSLSIICEKPVKNVEYERKIETERL